MSAVTQDIRSKLLHCVPLENGEGVLVKEATSHDDLFDSFKVIAAVLALML